MPEIGAARGVTKHTDLTNKEDAQGVIDHAAGSVTMAKLVQEVQDLINGALQKSGGTMTGNLTIEKAEPQLIFKEPLGIGVISTTLADEADIQVTTGGGFSVRTSNAAKSDYVDRLWIPGVTEIADILLQNSNLLLQAGRTVDGVDVSAHVAASPIDHPDSSIRPVKLDAIDSPANAEVPSYNSATGKFAWVPALVSANWQLVEAKTLASNQTNVDFENLDINSHGAYMLVVNAKTDGDSYLYLYANTDYTNSNYRTQQLIGSGSSALAARVSFPIITYCSGASIAVIYVFRDLDSYMRAVGWSNVYPAASVEIWENAICSVSTFTNITKLRIKGATSVILAGSKFWLFKMIP